jgi:chemotaxis family two-component system sensor kinase Cph1
MTRLLNDLLVYTEIEMSPRIRVSTDSNVVLAEVLLQPELQARMQRTQAVVTHDALPTVMANRRQLATVFAHLLDNAVTFHTEASPRVHLWATRDQHQWVFAVRDNGIGIAPEEKEKIFGLFKRLHPRSAYPGTGMGLAICKKVVERHGGRIWVESTPGQGTTFYFTLSDHVVRGDSRQAHETRAE